MSTAFNANHEDSFKKRCNFCNPIACPTGVRDDSSRSCRKRAWIACPRDMGLRRRRRAGCRKDLQSEAAPDPTSSILLGSVRASLVILTYRTKKVEVSNANDHRFRDGGAPAAAPEVDVLIEVPRGSFLKRGSTGHVDFISPLPCPFNYGAVPNYLGMEGDLLDALVLGPRLPLGTKVRIKAWGAVILTDRGMSDDKLICSDHPLSSAERRNVLRFFHFYAKCKGLLNAWRRRPGRNACDGWCGAAEALARARPREDSWHGSPVEF